MKCSWLNADFSVKLCFEGKLSEINFFVENFNVFTVKYRLFTILFNCYHNEQIHFAKQIFHAEFASKFVHY